MGRKTMATTDTSEKGLEALIVRDLCTSGGYVQGQPTDYNRDVAVDVMQLLAFLQAPQPTGVTTLGLAAEGIKRTQFLHRIQGEIAKRGVVDVLRKGVSHGPAHVDLYKLLPTPGNVSAAENFGKNIFSVTRQLRYSNDESQRSLDMAIFINGLPVLTFELKNSLTKQTVADAITQYQTDRNPAELLFQMGRCVAHMAVDDAEVRFCPHLTGKTSWFLPFNQGWNSGAGNPPNPHGLKTDYLWKQVLQKDSLANIIENFTQLVEKEDEKANSVSTARSRALRRCARAGTAGRAPGRTGTVSATCSSGRRDGGRAPRPPGSENSGRGWDKRPRRGGSGAAMRGLCAAGESAGI